MPASAAAPLNRLRSPLLRAAIDAFDEAGPDAAFEQGLAVIVDGLAKGGSLSGTLKDRER